MQDDKSQKGEDWCPYKNLLRTPKTKKEVVERLLEFFSAFVMLYVGWRVIFWLCPWIAPLLTHLFT